MKSLVEPNASGISSGWPHRAARVVEQHPVGECNRNDSLGASAAHLAPPARDDAPIADHLGRHDQLRAVLDGLQDLQLDPAHEPEQAAFAVPLAAEAGALGMDPGQVLGEAQVPATAQVAVRAGFVEADAISALDPLIDVTGSGHALNSS